MTHPSKTGLAFAIVATTFAFSASAATATGSWEFGERNGKQFVHAVTEAGPSVMLSCSDKLGVQATFYLNGNAIDDTAITSTAGLSTRNSTIVTDGTEEKEGQLLYLRPAKTLVTTESWQGKRVYNAAITGSPINMTVRRIGNVSFTLPGVDDSFTEFAQSCDATS